jgi:hypothetical protein
MKTLYKTAFILVIFANHIFAQSTTIMPGTVLPQMTTIQRTALVNVINGMLIFDTDTQSYWFRQSGSWVELPKGNYWQLSGSNGNEIANTNSGGFWSANASTVIYNPGTVPPPVSGAGTRLMWIPSKSAFRVGTVATNSMAWDAVNIGTWSFASGYNTVAKGLYSTAMGTMTTASGFGSTVTGWGTSASGDYSTAIGSYTIAVGAYTTTMGSNTLATGYSSTAIGNYTSARGDYSTAIGSYGTAGGDYSTVLGHRSNATGFASTVIGRHNNASGDYSTAIGHWVDTNNQRGVFMIGDSDPLDEGTTIGSANDQFVARFRNGYYLMTSGNTFATRTGIVAGTGANAWSAISDSTKKENYLSINGEQLLNKISQFRLGTWNYKGQDPKTFRHYGPMAQDFYNAFGRDALGTIGCDTLINQADFDGVNFTAIQALVKRTEVLRVMNEELRITNERLEARLSEMERLKTELLSLKNLILKDE